MEFLFIKTRNMLKNYQKFICTLIVLLLGSSYLWSSPTLYINNQVKFDPPVIYGWGNDAEGNSVSTDMPGTADGQVTKDGVTFDKFPLPDNAVGVELSIMYSNNWRQTLETLTMKIEDKDYWLVANASGLVPYVEGGNNTYYMLYVDPAELPFKQNTGYHINLYAVADDGSELYGPYPGKDYNGLTDIIDGVGYYIYNMPAGDKAYKLTFSKESENYKATSDFAIVPDKDTFVKLVGTDKVELIGGEEQPAAPTVYINNQLWFETPIVYGWGEDAEGNSVSTNMPGTAEGQVSKDGLTFDKFTLPDAVAGVKLTLMYSDNWRESTSQQITFEGGDQYYIATAAGLVPYIEGGNNTYHIIYVNVDDLAFKMNTGYDISLYAVSDDGTELYGPMPGEKYHGLTRIINDLGYYLYSVPDGNKEYTLTFTEDANNYKAVSPFKVIPDKDIYINLVGNDKVELGGDPSLPDTSGDIAYTVDDASMTATVTGLKDPDKGIENMVIPATVIIDGKEYVVTAIANNAFAGNSKITGTLTLGENLVTIGNKAFNNCQKITGSLVIGDKVTTIGESAFGACLGLDGTLTMGKSVESIGASAFLFCSSLKGGLNFPETLESIGEAAFSGCSKLDGEVKFGNKLATIGRQAFSSTSSLKGDLTLPNSLVSLGEAAFMSSGFDGTLTLPANMAVVPENVFFGCSNLSGNLTLPSTVERIEKSAFYNCSSLTGTLSIPNSVKQIGDGAFNQCKGFNGGLELGSGLESIGDGAFMFCENIMGWLTLPESLKLIGDNAFAMDAKLSGPITIPDNVTYIGSMAFGMCEGFNGKITIGKNVDTIGDQAFVSCSGLKGTLVIPEGVKSIGYRTFAWCWSLTGLELPSTLETLGNVAFYSCWNLETIKCAAVVPPVIAQGEAAFTDDNYKDATLFVPSEGYDAYKAANEWKEFMNIQWTGDKPPSVGVEGIGIDELGSDAVYYNLQGQRISTPAVGQVVIEKTASSIRKIVYGK